MLQKFFQKLRGNDLMLRGIVLLGLLGMGCILLSSFAKPSQRAQPEQETAELSAAQEPYRMALQAQLTDILGNISGVGRVEVLVTLGGSEEYHYAQEDERLVTEDQLRSSNTYVTVGGSSREALVESVSHPGITGVVVACDGGASSSVQEAVYKAVSVACGLPMSCIYVTKRAA